MGRARAVSRFKRLRLPLAKEPLKGRDVIRIESNDRVVQESYKTIDGSEVKVMEIVSTRKK